MQARGVVIEGIGTVYIVGLAFPLEGALAVKNQASEFLFGLVERIGVAVLHDEQSDVHHSVLADALIQANILVVATLDLLINVHSTYLQKK